MGEHGVSFVTANAERLAAAREHLSPHGIEVTPVTLDLDGIQARSVRDLVTFKARAAHRELGGPVLVEDTGFTIDELDFPGALAKTFVEAVGARGVVALADLTRTRAASLCGALAYIGPDGGEWCAAGATRRGTVATVPIGTEAPGAWPALWRVFIPEGHVTTVAALEGADRDRLLASWRRAPVFARLGEWLAGRDQTGADTPASSPSMAATSRSAPGSSE